MSEETVMIPHHMSADNFHRLFNMSKEELYAERDQASHDYAYSNPRDESFRHKHFDVWKMIKVKRAYGILG